MHIIELLFVVSRTSVCDAKIISALIIYSNFLAYGLSGLHGLEVTITSKTPNSFLIFINLLNLIW